MILILTACGSGSKNNAGGPATTETEGKVYNVNFGDNFHYYRTNFVTNITSKISIKLTDPQVLDAITENSEDIESSDFVKLFIQVENVGDGNSADAIGINNFTVYDVNGKDISTFYYWEDKPTDEFEGYELRPGGKNEGYIYLAIEEDSVPAEIIFYDSLIRGAHTNQFVIKM